MLSFQGDYSHENHNDLNSLTENCQAILGVDSLATKTTSIVSHEKWWDWKTIVSFWVSAYFRGELLNFGRVLLIG